MTKILASVLILGGFSQITTAEIIGKTAVIKPQVTVNEFIETTNPDGFYANKERCWLDGKLVDPIDNLEKCSLGDLSPGCELVVYSGVPVSFPAGTLKGEVVNFAPESGTTPWGVGYSRAEIDLDYPGDLQVSIRCYRAKGESRPLYYPEMATMFKGLAEIN